MTKGFRIKDLPVSERPRQRLLRYGAQSLSNTELLALLLRIGERNYKETALNLANKVLNKNGVDKLSRLSAHELMKMHGIGAANACLLAACFELGRRSLAEKNGNKVYLNHAKDIADMLMPTMSMLEQEHFKGIFLDTRNRLLRDATIFIGSLNASLVHPREVFKLAIAESAASIILCHNHPSGDPAPSVNDIKLTKKMVQIGELMGIEIADHIVIGKNKYVSMKEKGII
ncbi:DNA repair protein RadC [Candidatus Woesearchaeota archaeon]|nr:DNA repair protein RadC [Candidatus Woesearchaeota archaeon]